MKLNKLMLVSILLLAILTLGAVSAEENSAVDNLAVDSTSSSVSGDGVSYDKTIYVNTTGDDSNTGSQSSPYATINKGISSVNASDNAVIYLSQGTFTGENNTDLSISLSHAKYGGSLTIIGQGQDKTFIDCESTGSFLKSVSGDTALTLINMSFINGKAGSGSMITCGGNLTVNNCLFENNVATGSQGTLVSKGMDLKVINSVFRNNTAQNQGPDICFNNKEGNVEIINSSFYNATNIGYTCGASVYISNAKTAKVIGNTFKDITGNYNDASLQISGDGYAQVINNTFINCVNTKTYSSSWDQCGVVFFQSATIFAKGNKFINSSSNMGLIFNNALMNAVVTYEDAIANTTTFTLKANVVDDMGNSIASSRTLEFDINGKNVGTASVNNGVASLTVSKLVDNGKCEISGAYNGGANATFNNATLTVNINRNPVEYWVSTKGNDTTGDGSKNNPFNTINYAITTGLENSIDITLHIMDGTYVGTGNTNLKYDKIFALSIIGDNYSKAIIDGQNTDYFFSFNKEMIVTMSNLTFTNGKAAYISYNRGIIYGALMTMNNCIIKNSTSSGNLVYDIDTQNSNIIFNNLTYINNQGNMWLGYATINNSYFADNTGKGIGGVIRGTYFLTVSNSKFINNTNPGSSNSQGGAIYANNILSINNTYDSNYAATLGGAVYVSASSGSASFINDTFINNGAGTDGGAAYVYIYSSKEIPICTFENVKFINNTAKNNGGALSISGASFINTTFENNTAATGGAINVFSIKGTTYNIPDLVISDDSSFKNNNATNGVDIYITTPDTNYRVANMTGLTITFNDLNVTDLADKLTASITHPTGAIISGNTVTFFIDEYYAGIADVVNGIASYAYVGFEDGKYNLSGTYNADGKNYIYKNGTINVKISKILDNITVYVSDISGNDTTADGSLAKPFKTIRNALEYAQSKSRNVVVRVLEGNYTGELNSNLDIQVNTNIAIVGDGENKTIINDPSAKYFITALQGKGSLKIANMTIDRVGDYLNSALYVEKDTKVLIDSVAFINGKGNYGGAINTKGIVTIKNSYFFNNGYAKGYQNAFVGGAIYNDGYLNIDNTTFLANHATRVSTIANQGNLYMNNSQIIDAISAYGMNMDYMTIGAFNVGQVGNITLENTKLSLTGRAPLDIINSTDIYDGARSVTCLGLGSSENMILNNVTVDGNGSTTNGAYVFGGFNSWVTVGGGGTHTPKNIEVYNSTFSNLKSVNVFYTKVNSTRIFDGCIFDNVDYLVDALNSNEYDTLIIKNSVIFGDVKVGKVADTNNVTINLDNNWWGSNNATYYNAVIKLSGGMSSTITEVSKEITTPENYLVLTLDVTNKTGLLQNLTLAFKAFNGTNLSDYNGNLPVREFNMTMVNTTVSSINATLTNNFVNNFEAKEGNYTISATVDGQTVSYNGSAAIGAGIIEVKDIILNYGDAIIANATLVDTKGNLLANVNMTLKVNGKTYFAVTDENGVATFVVDQLNTGKYNLTYSVADSKVIFDVTNSSTLTINKVKDSLKVDIDATVAGEDVVITVTGPKDLKENVTVVVDKKTYNVKLINGSNSITIKNLTAGDYDVVVTYPGDNNYDKQVINTNFTVDINKKVNLDVSDIVMLYKDGTRLVAILTDYLGNPIANATVYFTINGQTYNRTTDAKGSASMALNLVSKVYKANVLFNGSDVYDKVSKDITVTINPTIIANDIVKMYQNDTQFYATFLGKDGKVLANTDVTFNINGVLYTKQTNASGVAKLSINLRPGNYTLTAINPFNEEQLGFNVLVKSLIEASDLTKYYLNASKFEATVYNKNGSLAINKEVTFNINGVLYKRTTNTNGVVSLTINLRPENYTITTMYDGLSVGNNVNVLPTLITSDLSMKFQDGSKFTAQTLDGQGKPLANQNVTFNVNGVFYYKTTGDDGIASLNINLNRGSYIITSMWDKYQVGNKITIV